MEGKVVRQTGGRSRRSLLAGNEPLEPGRGYVLKTKLSGVIPKGISRHDAGVQRQCLVFLPIILS